MRVYAESSAVLAWLLGEEDGQRVREVLGRSELMTASDLTLIECDRVLIRAVVLGEIDEARAADRRAHLNTAAAHRRVWRLSADLLTGRGVRFLWSLFAPSMPFTWRRRWRCVPPGVELLSLDDRIRRSDAQFGFRLEPE